MTKDWTLEKYFYNSITDERIEQDLETYKSNANAFISKYQDKISELSEEDFLKFLQELDVLGNIMQKIFIYLSLMSSLDTQNQAGQKAEARLNKIYSEYSEKFLFLEEEYKKIGYRKFEALASLDIMKPYKNYLISAGQSIQYLLSEPEEKVVIKLFNVYDNNMHEELTSSFDFEFKGEKISEDEVRMHREDQDRETRLLAWKTLAKVYLTKQNQIVIGNLYSMVCKDNVADVELRKYKTVMSQRNISEEVSDETVDSLLKNVSDNYSIYHRFLMEKANILQFDSLETQDIFAPYPVMEDIEGVPFEEGWEMYKRTIEKVDPLLAEFSQEMLDSGRISVYPRQGKTSGAYAQYAQHLPEFVLLNWANTTSDVATLAHELGHAFHGKLSKKQTGLVYSTPLILAETASIFNETLMFETMLENTLDKEKRNQLICGRLDDIFSTIFRQVAYVCFEKRCHESFQNNKPLTYEDYNAMWVEEISRLYGDAVKLDVDLIKHGWSSISHIFQTPFYCYTYAFGNIISLNIYQAYKESVNKEEFIKKYHAFLEAGGSDTPENLLKNIFGIEINEAFYKLAFTNIENLMNQLEA